MRWSSSVCVKGGELLNGVAVEMLAVLAPGVVGRWGLRGSDQMVERFSIGDFGLADRLLEDRVR